MSVEMSNQLETMFGTFLVDAILYRLLIRNSSDMVQGQQVLYIHQVHLNVH